MRRQLKARVTEAEKAITPLTDAVEDGADLVTHIAKVLNFIEYELGCDNREACCALRDYAQLMVARHMDAQYEATQARIKELQDKLKEQS